VGRDDALEVPETDWEEAGPDGRITVWLGVPNIEAAVLGVSLFMEGFWLGRTDVGVQPVPPVA
jgi:hypothetical protein